MLDALLKVMKLLFKASIALILTSFFGILNADIMKSIQDYGVLPTNSPEVNRDNLQKAIDEATDNGGILFVPPVARGYPIASGVILKRNVSLVGANGPLGRGSTVEFKTHPKFEPAGSTFRIMDAEKPFITVSHATKIKGIQFYYPKQGRTPETIIKYPPTIQQDTYANSVTLQELTFWGEYIAMNFADTKGTCEQILIEHCYGYPYSGEFIRIDHCADINRILHCHINPGNMRGFRGTMPKSVIDHIVAQKKYAIWVGRGDNIVIMDLHVFGLYGACYFSTASYGQLTSFSFDCVVNGIYKKGGGQKHHQWMISQGSIIANAGTNIDEVWPIVIEGQGHTSIANVEAFSGGNGALTNVGASKGFLLVKGNDPLTVALNACRMNNYVDDEPIQVKNKKASLRARDCVGKDLQFFDLEIK